VHCCRITSGFNSSISSEPKVSSPVRPASNWLLPVKDTFGQENECLPTQIAPSTLTDTPTFQCQSSLMAEERNAHVFMTGKDIEPRPRSG
jgi:hypothetical protein